MDQSKLINIKDTKYYTVSDIFSFAPEFFYGFTKKHNNIVVKKKIPDNDIVWAYYNKNKLVIPIPITKEPNYLSLNNGSMIMYQEHLLKRRLWLI